jgi:mercuric ion transport protein
VPKAERRRVLPAGLTGLAGAACVACCAIPLMLAAGALGGAGWVVLGRVMPGVAMVLAALAAVAWWWASRRRHTRGCAAGGCSCGERSADESAEVISVRSLL